MRLASLLLLSILLCFSCGNDDEPAKEGNCMTAVINGEEFTAESTTGTFNIITIEYNNLGTQETKVLTIIGTIPSITGVTKTITLNFACSEFEANLDVATSDADCGVGLSYNETSFTNPNDAIAVMAFSGAINIEEATDDKIRGTFSFSGEDQNGVAYNITDGFFDTTIL